MPGRATGDAGAGSARRCADSAGMVDGPDSACRIPAPGGRADGEQVVDGGQYRAARASGNASRTDHCDVVIGRDANSRIAGDLSQAVGRSWANRDAIAGAGQQAEQVLDQFRKAPMTPAERQYRDAGLRLQVVRARLLLQVSGPDRVVSLADLVTFGRVVGVKIAADSVISFRAAITAELQAALTELDRLEKGNTSAPPQRFKPRKSNPKQLF